jgi:hypothetical protein
MYLSNPLIVLAVIFTFLSGILFIFTIIAIKKKKLIATAMYIITSLLMLSLSALFSTITIAIKGYQALTREELAAIVKVEPTGKQRFTVWFTMPDGSEKKFLLAGDQLYVDAHILKWKPIANILGLHTSYELDRVAGRYSALSDETTKLHTVYSLSKDKPVNMFDLRQRFALLNPLLDAEYGSATFINSNSVEEFKLLVSTTGLLIRRIDKKTSSQESNDRFGMKQSILVELYCGESFL